MSSEPRWVDRLIVHVLRGGVTVSVIIVLAGLIITFVHHREYFRSRPALDALTNPGASYPSTIGSVVEGVRKGRGQAIATLGLLLLIATPVARVAVSIAVFVIERDRLYVVITAVVLALLLLSFVLGASG
ncbi:MAG TPA: DUF1634 domain-containing protein [Thermoanaerobaculia bacterium]